MKAASMAGRRTGRVMRKMVFAVEAPQTWELSSREASKAAMAGAMIR